MFFNNKLHMKNYKSLSIFATLRIKIFILKIHKVIVHFITYFEKKHHRTRFNFFQFLLKRCVAPIKQFGVRLE